MWRIFRLPFSTTLLSKRRFSTPKLATFPTRFHGTVASTAADPESTDVLRARLLYQSKKRGILENDIIIGGFAAKHLAEMTHAELTAYDEIINGAHMEWDLYYYCVGRRQPPKSLADCAVFKRMCEFAQRKSDEE